MPGVDDSGSRPWPRGQATVARITGELAGSAERAATDATKVLVNARRALRRAQSKAEDLAVPVAVPACRPAGLDA
jgi:hypothetical protein